MMPFGCPYSIRRDPIGRVQVTIALVESAETISVEGDEESSAILAALALTLLATARNQAAIH